MTTTLSRTQQNDIINLANSAVRSRVAKKYKGIFSTMDIEDMVGDTIYKACRSIGSFDASKGKLITWINTIASNCIKDLLDYKFGRGFISADVNEDMEPERIFASADHTCGSQDWESNIDIVYGDLLTIAESFSERDRRYAQMIIDEFESAEMAKATGDTLGAAQAKACRVRKILRERYGERIAA